MFLVIVFIGVIGILIATIFHVAYSNGWVIDEFITGSITINDLSTIIVILFSIIGVIVGAIYYGR